MTRDEVVLRQHEGQYVLAFGEHALTVDPAYGGRVVSFSLAGHNVLAGREVVAAGDLGMQNNFGSTFWTSPQSDWGWPPEEALDRSPYEAQVEGAVLALHSRAGEKTGYAVTKRFRADAARKRVSIDYELVNVSATRPAAPWQVSRVRKAYGVVFFPSEGDPVAPSTLESVRVDGVAWFDAALAPARDGKLFHDGSEGWLAYTDGQYLLVKAFEDVARSEQAPGEADVELYVNDLYDYMELEVQGRYQAPAPGARATWRVDWYLRRLPERLEARVGNPELVRFVRELLASGT